MRKELTIQEWGPFMELKYKNPVACRLCNLILWPSDSIGSHLRNFPAHSGPKRFPEEIVKMHQEAWKKYSKFIDEERGTKDLFDFYQEA